VYGMFGVIEILKGQLQGRYILIVKMESVAHFSFVT
jgi:hypothetical protein